MSDKGPSRHLNRFASELHRLTASNQLSTRQLAERTGTTYEHIRKLLAGEALPSKRLLKDIAQVLGTSASLLQEAADLHRVEHKYGKLLLRVAGRNPELHQLDLLWPSLTGIQKDELIALARFFVDRNSNSRQIVKQSSSIPTT